VIADTLSARVVIAGHDSTEAISAGTGETGHFCLSVPGAAGDVAISAGLKTLQKRLSRHTGDRSPFLKERAYQVTASLFEQLEL
jgi:hypothetical protein